jgi:hypothetical protein
MEKPYEITKKEVQEVEKMAKRAQELKEKFDKEEEFVFDSTPEKSEKPSPKK